MGYKKTLLLVLILALLASITVGCSRNRFQDQFKLTVEIGSGQGTIEVTPEKTNYNKGEKVQIEAIAADGYQFDKWEGSLTGTEKSMLIVIDSNMTLIANFIKKDYPLTIKIKPHHLAGVVEEEVITITASGSDEYEYETTVQLTATPLNAGYVFERWEGDLTGNVNPASITIDMEKTVTAVFKLNQELVTVNGPGDVEVIRATSTFNQAALELTALAMNTGVFEGWEGFSESDIEDCSNPFDPLKSKWVVLKNIPGNITANFSEIKGALTLVNSWGANWGPKRDGKIEMTYAAAIDNNVWCFVTEPREHYQPQALAVFDLDGMAGRANVDIHISAYRPGTSEELAKKDFYPFTFLRGGWVPFPDNPIALDITEVLQEANNKGAKSVDLIFSVVNKDSYLNLTLNSFQVELYTAGYSTNPADATATYECLETPGPIDSDGPEAEREFKIANVDLTDFTSPLMTASYAALDLYSTALNFDDIAKIGQTNQNYEGNVIITGLDGRKHGTGLRAFTEQQWDDVLTRGYGRLIDSPLAGALPARLDLTELPYFPPIGDQMAEGSCVAWATTYYTMSFYQARQSGWDYTGQSYETAEKSQLISPEFTYHMVNNGEDAGSIYLDVMQIGQHIGAPSLAKMDYSDINYTKWPEEAAWREAPLYRSSGFYQDHGSAVYFIIIDSREDIDVVKSLLHQGYLVTVSIDANKYYQWEGGRPVAYHPYLSVENYRNPRTNHANTVAAYDDNFSH